jgi:undecaprenyl-phosphate 4-deoxy-4-formamido-L-arabinose transferase
MKREPNEMGQVESESVERADHRAGKATHEISVVIPVYKGERTLPSLIGELLPLTKEHNTPGGNVARVTEVILVWDNGPDESDRVIRELAAKHDFVRPVWLSRNFGQHAATLAGIANSAGDWVSTIDEDGQHDPVDIDRLLDTGLEERAAVVYARPTNASSHGAFRDVTSRGAKWVLKGVFGGGRASEFQSFRLVLGEVARSVAEYAGANVYLDVALSWAAARTTSSPVRLRDEGDRRSGYSLRSLLSHFLRMVLSTGTRALRLVAALGATFALAGVGLAIYFIVVRFVAGDVPEGWTSMIVALLVSSGAILFSLGIIAEYLGVAVNAAMGKPHYLVVRDPDSGPLGSNRSRRQ